MFTLNPHSGQPIYRQLIEQIRRLISSGQLKPGAELPSVRELAERHAVNPMTISKAYGLLEAEGLLARQRGKPMMIAQRSAISTDPSSRLNQITPQIEQLVLSARQLNLSADIVCDAILSQWKNHE